MKDYLRNVQHYIFEEVLGFSPFFLDVDSLNYNKWHR